MTPEIKKAVVDRSIAALRAIGADYIIQVQGLGIFQTEDHLAPPVLAPDILTTTPPKHKYKKPNCQRTFSWAYHEKVRGMVIGDTTVFVVPKDLNPREYLLQGAQVATPKDYFDTVFGYARHYHKATLRNMWDVKYDGKAMYLTRLM